MKFLLGLAAGMLAVVVMISMAEPRRQAQEFDELLKIASAKFQQVGEVHIKFRNLDGLYGYTEWDGERFVITLDEHMPWDVAVDTFAHEYAHAVAWDFEPMHSRAWGIAYAACYRLLIDER